MDDDLRKCQLVGCDTEFLPKQSTQKYCCDAHKKSAENARWYANHRQKRIAQVEAHKLKPRLKAELTVSEIARAAQASDNTVRNYISGDAKPPLPAVLRETKSGKCYVVQRDDFIKWALARGWIAAIKRLAGVKRRRLTVR